MGCNKYKNTVTGEEFGSLEELRQYYVNIRENDGVISHVSNTGLMLIPDFTTKLKVDFSGEIKESLGIDEGFYTYDELVLLIGNISNSDKLPEDILKDILNDKLNGYGIAIHLPVIKTSYNKSFISYDINDIPSDIIIEARSVYGEDNIVLTGPQSYITKKIKEEGYSNLTFEFNKIERTIEAERRLEGYDYVKEGVSIKQTNEYTSLWEFSNKKPRYKGKYSNAVMVLYLSNKGYNKDEVNLFLEKYNNSIIIDSELNKNILTFLTTFDIEEKDNISEERIESVLNKAEYNKKINSKEMYYRSFFRSKLIARIEHDGYAHKPSEVIAPLPNIQLLGVDMESTLEEIRDNEFYFNHRLEDTNYIDNAPVYKGYLDLETFTVNDLDIIISKLGSSKNDLKSWKWFSQLEFNLFDIKQAFSTGQITAGNLDTKVKQEIESVKIAMYNDLAKKRRISFEKSLLLITSRIPSQAKQSTSFSEIIAIENSRHTGIYESHENFIIKGQDNDGDKLNTLFVQLDKHGVIIDYTKYLNDSGKFDGYNPNGITDYVKVVSDAYFDAKIKTIITDKNRLAKSYALYIENKEALESGNEDVVNNAKMIMNNSPLFNVNPNTNEQLKVDEAKENYFNNVANRRTSDKLIRELSEVIDNDDFNELSRLESITPDQEGFSDARNKIQKINNRVDKSQQNIISRYKSALKNYIIDTQMEIHKDPRTAIEKEIPVDNVITDALVKEENVNNSESTNDVSAFTDAKKYTHNTNITGFGAAESAIHEGDTQISVVANFIRLSNMFKEVATQLKSSNRSLYDLKNKIDMSYYKPVMVDGKVIYKKEKVILGRPLAFDEIVREDYIDSGDNFGNIHNLNNNDSIVDDIVAYNNYVNAQIEANTVIDNLNEETKDFLNNANSMSKEEFIDFLYKQQIWEDLSEIMTGAVDNAKLLVLTKLGINSLNIKYALTMLTFGVSIQDVVAILRQKDIIQAQKLYNTNANKNGLQAKSFKSVLKTIAESKFSKNRSKAYKLKRLQSKKDKIKAFQFAKDFTTRKVVSAEPLNLMSIQGLELESIANKIINGDSAVNVKTEELVSDNSVSENDAMSQKLNNAITKASNIVIFVNDINSVLDENSEVIRASEKDVFIIDKNNTVYSANQNDIINIQESANDIFLEGDTLLYNNDSDNYRLPKSITDKTNELIYSINTTTDINDVVETMLKGIDLSISNAVSNITESEVTEIERLENYDLEHNPAENMLALDSLTKELNVALAVMSFKNGKNNKDSDMKNYIVRIEGAVNTIFRNAGKRKFEFDLFKFVSDTKYRADLIMEYEDIKFGINPLTFILQVEDLKNYLFTLGSQEMLIRKTDDITSVIDTLHYRIFKDKPVSVQEYRILKQGVNNFIVDNYIKSDYNNIKTYTIEGKTHDLTTKQGQNDFVINFPSYIDSLKKSEDILIQGDDTIDSVFIKDNYLIQNIRPSGQSREEYGPDVEFLGLPRNVSKDANLIASLEAASEDIRVNNQALHQALFLYDILITGGSFSQSNIGNMLGSEVSVGLNESVKRGDFSFDNIKNVNLDYFMLLNPGLFKNKHDDTILNVNIDSYGVITGKITKRIIESGKISYKSHDDNTPFAIPLIKNKIRQTGSEIIIEGDKNTNVYDMYEKAGYKVGYDVKVLFGNDMVDAVLLGQGKAKEYIVNVNGKIEHFTEGSMKKWNENFYFNGRVFGPKSIYKNIIEKEYKARISGNEKNKVNNTGSVRYKLLGEETELGFFSNKFKKGDIIETVKMGNGSKYALVFDGFLNNNGKVTKLISNFLDPDSTKIIKNEKNEGKRYAIATYKAIDRVTNKVYYNNISKSKLRQANSLKPLESKVDTRSTHLWTTISNAESFNMSTLGSEGQVNVKDRVYVLKTKAISNHWESAARTIGIDMANMDNAKKQLKVYMNITEDYLEKNNQLKSFFNAEPSDLGLIGKDIAVIEAIPMSKSGSNNTYEETQLVKEEKNFSHNLDNQSSIIRSTSSTTTRDALGATLTEAKITKTDLVGNLLMNEMVDDMTTLNGKINSESNTLRINPEDNSVKDVIDRSSNAINNSDIVIIETSSLSYATSKESAERVNGIIPDGTSFNSFKNIAKRNGLRTPIDWVNKINEITEILNKESDILNLYERNELEKYSSVVFDDSVEMIADISRYYTLEEKEEGFVSKTQRVFAEGQDAFLSLQLAKNIAEDPEQSKSIYVYSTVNELWYKYNQPTGDFIPVTSIPRVDGKKVAYLGRSDKGLDTMLKLTSYDKNKSINPAFVYNHNYMINDNSQPLEGTELDKANYNPVILSNEDGNLEVETIISNNIVFHSTVEVNPVTVNKNDITDLTDYNLHKYSDGVVTLESLDSNTVYIVKISNEQRIKYDNLGTAIENTTLKFNHILGDKSTDNIIRFDKVYKTNKRSFEKRGTSGTDNTDLENERQLLVDFTTKNIDIDGAILNMNEMIQVIRGAISNSSSEIENDWYLSINSYVDFIVRLEQGIFDKFLNGEQIKIKDTLLNRDKELSVKKKEYRDSVASKSKKNGLKSISITSTILTDEKEFEYAKVFFNSNGATRDNIISANKGINISGEESVSQGYYNDKKATGKDGNEIGERDTLYGLTVYNDYKLDTSLRIMLNRAKNGTPLYVSFNDTRDSNNNFKELFPGVSYETIAKSFARVIRGNNSYVSLIADNKVIFNNEAAELINSTDGKHSLSDINSNKIYKLSSVSSVDTFDAGWLLNFNEMKLGDRSLMDVWNEKLGVIGNTNKYESASESSDLGGAENSVMQLALDNLLINYFNNNHDELVMFMAKLKGRNFYDRRKGSYSVEQSMANIINNINSINFLFSKKITALPVSLVNNSFAVVTENELKEFPFTENGSEVVYEEDGVIYKVKIEDSFDTLITEGRINKKVDTFDISIGTNKAESLKDTKGDGKYYILSSTVFDNGIDLINESKENSTTITESGIKANNNLNENSFLDATIIYTPNIKQSVLTKTGVEKSKSISEWVDAFGNAIVTDVKPSDTIIIKSPYFGDLDSASRNDFYDAFIKFNPVLDSAITAKANIILSGGVTFNEYNKAYLINQGYKYDNNKKLFTFDEVDDADSQDIFKVMNGNFFNLIGNEESGKSGMPGIVHDNENDASDYNSSEADNMVRLYHTDFDKINQALNIADKNIIKNILSEYKPDSFSNSDDVNIRRDAHERRSVLFVKLAIAVNLFGNNNDIVFSDDIDKAIGSLYNFLSKNENERNIYNEYVDKFITDDLFNENVNNTQKLSMIIDFNAINIFLKENLAININLLGVDNNSFNTLSDKFRLEKIIKGKKAYKSLLKESDFNIIDDISVLDLFVFANAIDSSGSIDKEGNVDFGSTLHNFVKNGINGIKLADGSISLFESMNVFNSGVDRIDITPPERGMRKLNNETKGLIVQLSKFEDIAPIVNTIASTSRKNLPFSLDGDTIYFYKYDGTIVELDKTKDLYTFVNLLKANTLNSILKDVGFDNRYNMSILNDGSSSHIKANIGGVLKSKALDKIKSSDILFTSFLGINDFNENEYTIGSIYNYKEQRGIVLKSNIGEDILLLDDGSSINIFTKTIVDKSDINDQVTIGDVYAKPSTGRYNYLRYNEDGNYKIVSGDIIVDSSLEATDDDGNTYKYNYNINIWEKSVDVVKNNKVSLSASYSHIGRFTNSDELKATKTLFTNNGMVIKLGEFKEFITVENIKSYDKDSNGNKINENEFKLSGKSSWVQVGQADSFKFRSNIESIKLNGNTIESKRVGVNSLSLIINYFNELYPNKDISKMYSNEIAEYYGEDFAEKGAFTYNGTIVFNIDKVTLDSPVHELGHLYIEEIKTSNPEMYALLMEKAFDNAELMNEIRLNGIYKDAIEIAEETIVVMMGYNSQGRMENLISDKSVWQSILDFFSNIFNSAFGVNNIKLEDINTSLTDIINTLTEDVLYGEKSIFNQLGYQEKKILSNKTNKVNNKELLVKKLISLGLMRVKPSESKLNISSSKLYC